MATQGNPSAYSFCLPENEEASPWEPLSVDMGFKPGREDRHHLLRRLVSCGQLPQWATSIALIRAIRYFEWAERHCRPHGTAGCKDARNKGEKQERRKNYITPERDPDDEGVEAGRLLLVVYRAHIEGEGDVRPEVLCGPRNIWACHDDAVVQIYPRQNVHVVVVGGETNPMMQGWRFAYPFTASVDKWR